MARRLQVLQGHLQGQEEEDGIIGKVPLSSFLAGPHLVRTYDVSWLGRLLDRCCCSPTASCVGSMDRPLPTPGTSTHTLIEWMDRFNGGLVD